MILAFAFDTRKDEPPYSIVPILESSRSEASLREVAAARLGCEQDDIGIETVGGEDADVLIGNLAPAGQVLDLAVLAWDDIEEELTYEYKAEPI
jgi:hypothetical protein